MITSLTLAATALSYQQITVFLLAFGVLLGTARLFGEIARRYGQPMVLGEILAGVVLGATVLGNPAFAGEEGWNVQFYDWLFPVYVTNEDGHPVRMVRVQLDEAGEPNVERAADNPAEELPVEDEEEVKATDSAPVPVDHEKAYDGGYLSMEMFLTLSAVFLLLVAGLEVDLSVVWRQGKAALLVSLAGMVVPGAAGFALAWYLPTTLGFDDINGELVPFALFVAIAMSITALPVIAKVLMDLDMFRSDIGMLIMSSAMVNDLVGWVGFAIVLALMGPAIPGAEEVAGSATSDLFWTIGLTLLFVGGMLTLGRWVFHKILPFVQAYSSWPGGVLGFVLSVSLVCAAATEAIGIHSIFGAFIAGVAIGDSAHLRRKTRETVEAFITYIFAPVFFAGIALRVNFVEGFDLVTVTLVLGVAIAGKVIGCYFGAKFAGLPKRQSWAIGFGMSARGAMEIILGQLALSQGLITEKLFVAIVVMAIATSLIAGPTMQWALRRKQKKTLNDFLGEGGFAGRLESHDRRDAIRELSEVAAKLIDLKPGFIEGAVWRRERYAPTGLHGSLAVPHARLTGIKKPIVVVGQSEGGIDFDAPDGSYANIICLLLSPADDPEAQLDMLRAVADAFQSEQTMRECLDAKTGVEFRAALSTTKPEQDHGTPDAMTQEGATDDASAESRDKGDI